jgi:hypothetical protein
MLVMPVAAQNAGHQGYINMLPVTPEHVEQQLAATSTAAARSKADSR